MGSIHPARAKALLRRALTVDRVWTTAQLERRGLLAAGEFMELPIKVLTCRTRVTQSESDVDLTFVALHDQQGVLYSPGRDLMHLAALAEARERLGVLPETSLWRHLALRGRLAGELPDAEIVDMTDRLDAAVEFDAGYSSKKIRRKLASFASDGYRKLYWATSIHGRVDEVHSLIHSMHAAGELPHVIGGAVLFVNFWTSHNPYVNRPRCRKSFIREFAFADLQGRSA